MPLLDVKHLTKRFDGFTLDDVSFSLDPGYIMDIVVSLASGTPIYQQIALQVSAQIVRGDLAPGSPLPPIRSLARQLDVSVITVKKAWETLEQGGLIFAVVGRGTFVADHPGELVDLRAAKAAEQMTKDLRYYADLGLSADDVVALVRQLYRPDNDEV